MASVTFKPELGGSGITISDDADPNTGLANGGHRERFVPALQGTIDMAQYVYQYAAKIDGAAEDAERAEEARGYVEAYEGALKRNIQAHYDQYATRKLHFARGKYIVDDGSELLETTVLADAVTVTRSGPKWVEGPNGRIREVATDTAARRWRGGVPQGLLIEGGRENQIIYSEDLTQWNGDTGAVSATTMASPIEGVNYQAITISEGMTRVRLSRSVSVTNNMPYKFSLFCDKGAVGYVTLREPGQGVDDAGPKGATFNMHSRTFQDVFGYSVTDFEQYADGSFRIWVGYTAQADGSGTVAIDLLESNGVGDVLCTGAQFEESYLPTSYVPTLDTPSTRPSDNVEVSLGGEFNPHEFTVFADTLSIPGPYSRSGNIFNLYSSTSLERITVTQSSFGSIRLFVRYSSGSIVEHPLNDGGYERRKYALSFDSKRGSIVVACGGVVSDEIQLEEAFDESTLDSVDLDGYGGVVTAKELADLTVMPMAFTGTELGEMTA